MKEPIDIHRVSLLWALAENAAEVAGLHGELFAEAWDTSAVLALLEHPGATALIARSGGKAPVAGFVIGRIVADEAEVLSLGVRASHQRHGIAKQLFGGFRRAVERAEVKRVFLEVADDNAAALGLYQGLGFREGGRRKGYYKRKDGPACDALVLALTLG